MFVQDGFPLAFQVFLLFDSCRESIEHVFSTRQVAVEVWNYFYNMCGVIFPTSNLRARLVIWWFSSTSSDKRRFVFTILPSFMCWNIWMAGSIAVFEGVKPQSQVICQAIFQDVKAAFEIQFKQVVESRLFLNSMKQFLNHLAYMISKLCVGR